MARGLTAGMVTGVTGKTVHPAIFIELQFDSGTLRYWNHRGDITWNGQTWTGLGHFLSFSSFGESQAVKAIGAAFTLSGMPAALIAIAETETYQNRPCLVWFALLDDAGAPIADPYQCFVGRMDTIADSDDGQTATLTLSVENELADLEGAADRRYTPEDQALDFPEETGSPNHRDRLFDPVAALQEMEIVLE